MRGLSDLSAFALHNRFRCGDRLRPLTRPHSVGPPSPARGEGIERGGVAFSILDVRSHRDEPRPRLASRADESALLVHHHLTLSAEPNPDGVLMSSIARRPFAALKEVHPTPEQLGDHVALIHELQSIQCNLEG